MHITQTHTDTATDTDADTTRPPSPTRLPGPTPGARPTGARPNAPHAPQSPHVPVLHHRRDGILPTVAAALSVRGTTLTGTAARSDQAPALHPLVQELLDTLPSSQRDRFTGRCAETLLISRQLGTTDAARSKRAQRKPMTATEARKTLKNAKLTTRHIREDGDPLHGSFAHPCRSCTALAAHFGIHIVDSTAPSD